MGAEDGRVAVTELQCGLCSGDDVIATASCIVGMMSLLLPIFMYSGDDVTCRTNPRTPGVPTAAAAGPAAGMRGADNISRVMVGVGGCMGHGGGGRMHESWWGWQDA